MSLETTLLWGALAICEGRDVVEKEMLQKCQCETLWKAEEAHAVAATCSPSHDHILLA